MLPMLGLASLSLALVAYGGLSQTNVSAEIAQQELHTDTLFNVNNELVLSVTLPTIEGINITPDHDGKFQSTSVPVTVSSNNFFGYTLTMEAYNPYTNQATTSLTSSQGVEIENIASETAESGFTNNTWGYRLDDNDNYSPLSTTITLDTKTAEKADTSTGAAGGGMYNLDFGVKVNDEIPNGTYSVALKFIAVATKPDSSYKGSTFDRAFAYAGVKTYGETSMYAMQDITDDICQAVYTPTNSTDTHNSLQLIDKCDSKTYWVTKLADGNCWMTQNLDLDLTNGVELTPEDSDVKANWDPGKSTVASSALQNNVNWTNDPNTPYSVDPGDIYWDNDASVATCNYFTKGTKETNDGCASFSTSPFGSYGKHGHVGNYYNWSATVASNNTAATTGDGAIIDTSICPAGWRLPTGGSSGEFQALQNEYNWVTGTIQKDPGYFVRGGFVGSAALGRGGDLGRYWSSTAKSDTNAYYLSFDSSSVYPAGSYDLRSYGSSVRCIVRQPQS